MRTRRPALAFVAALLALGVARGDDPPAFAFGEPREVCTLADRAVKESSGLAPSRTIAGALWTHNDSGDQPRLFLFDRAGKSLATFAVEGAENDDWEDLAAFEHGGASWLVVADTGDNDGVRAHVVLYLVKEPRSAPPAGAASLPLARAVKVVWEGGPIDCEGLGVDVESKQVLLVTKVRRGREDPAIFALPLEALVGARAPEGPVEAKKLASLPGVPRLTTALDVSPDGRRLVVLTYGDAHGWARSASETWSDALARPGTKIPLPRREQGEAVCFGLDGRSLLLTSEGRPCPVWELPAR